MTYKEKLEHPKWQERRLLVLQRDGLKCRACGDTETMLHVHHTVYDFNREPWEAEDIHLVTLCKHCHKIESDLKNFDLMAAMHMSGFTKIDVIQKFWPDDKDKARRIAEYVKSLS